MKYYLVILFSMEKQFSDLFREVLKESHETLEATIGDATDVVLHYQPAGKALPVGAAYGHAVISEDMLLNGFVKKSAPLLDSWKGKLGLSIPHPVMDQDWEKNFIEWQKNVKMDLAKFKEYAKAVYKQSDEFIAGHSDKELMEKQVDLSTWGLGNWSVAKFLMRMVIGHCDNLTGEVSAAKGIQGLKGYPF